MPETHEDYESPKPFMEIDKNRLDDEWLEQPKLYLEYAEKLAQAKSDLDEASILLKVTKSEVELDIRENPGDHGILKITESLVEAAVVANAKYQKTQRAHNNTRNLVLHLEAAVEALNHRKRTLENLVELHGQMYFAEPRAGAKGKEEVGKASIRSKGSRR